MQELYLPFAITLVVLTWLGVLHVIRNWGTGFPNRWVRCPHEDKPATVSTACSTKGGWGRAMEKDILGCSLLPGKPVTCDKSCLSQL